MTTNHNESSASGQTPGVFSVQAGGHMTRRFVMTFAGLLFVWVLLTGTLNIQELAVGVLVAAGTAAISIKHLSMLDDVVLTPLLPLHLARYFFSFFKALIVANLDVARRVILPGMNIRPAVVRVHTELQSDLGKLWLANSITLTPGTLTVDLDGQELLIHWIDATPGTDLETATREIVAGFESVLKEFLR